MSEKYDEYLKEHRHNVSEAFVWLQQNLPELFEDLEETEIDEIDKLIDDHDDSKWNADEYGPYDRYFYGGNKSYAVKEEFNKAWLLHIHRNPHHWQYWILINDNPDEGEIILDMPDHYIIEMICDWWSFSWKKGNLWEIFNWYDERSNHIKLSDYTRKKVIDIFEKMQAKLYEINGGENNG